MTVDERGKEIAREFESRLGTLVDFSDTFLTKVSHPLKH